MGCKLSCDIASLGQDSLMPDRFLWAVCQMDKLSRVRTTVSVDMLQALPPGLAQTFEAQLERLSEEDLDLALHTLRFIMYSYRELDLPELIEGLAINSDVRTLDQLRKHTLRNPTDLFEICGCLIKQSTSTGLLSLGHYSVYEFLSSPVLEKGRSNRFFLAKPEAVLQLFTLCVTYLSMDDFNLPSFTDSINIALDAQATDTGPQSFSDSPFLDYAATYWWRHLKDTANSVVHTKWPLLLDFIEPERRNFDAWAMVARYLYGDYHYPPGTNAIHVAALHGLSSLAYCVLDRYPDCIGWTTRYKKTALHVATENASHEVLCLLLERIKTAQPEGTLEAKDIKGRSALCIAVESGNSYAVDQLLHAGAAVDSLTEEGDTPISIAVQNKQDNPDHWLSKMTSRNMASRTDGRSLLHLAAQSGSLDWATSLIQHHRPLLNSIDMHGWTPLHYAADHGHGTVVQLLLKSGSYVFPRDSTGWTPLHAAVRRHHISCAVHLLESTGPRAPTTLPSGQASWTRASRQQARSYSSGKYGRHIQGSTREGEGSGAGMSWAPDIVSRRSMLFPSSGAGMSWAPDSVSRSSRLFPSTQIAPSPLYMAVSESYVQAVELLLRHLQRLPEVDDHELGRCLDKSLELPSTEAPIVGLLIGSLPDSVILQVLANSGINDQHLRSITTMLHQKWSDSYVYSTVLPNAIASRSKAACQFLLQNWTALAEVEGGSLVHQVLTRGGLRCNKQDIIQLLVENGAPVTELSSEGYTPLQTCFLDQEYELASLLIRLGARDTPCSRHGQTALLVLLDNFRGNKERTKRCTELLVAAGADIHVVDPSGRGVCHKSVTIQDETLLDWFLNRGAAPDLSDKTGDTPLHVAVRIGFVSGLPLLHKHVRETMDPARQLGLYDYSNSADSLLVVAVDQQRLDVLRALVELEHQDFSSTLNHEKTKLKQIRAALYADMLCKCIQSNFWTGFCCLLSHMEEVSIVNAHGFTPLQIAARGEYKYVEKLLEKGADVGVRTIHGNNTAADIAFAQGSSSILALLLDYGAETREEYLTWALHHDNFELATSLIGRGVALQTKHLESLAEKPFSMQMTRLLLDYGAKAQPHHIQLAIQTSDPSLLRQLLSDYPNDMNRQLAALIAARVARKHNLVDILMRRWGQKLESLVAEVENDTKGGTILHGAARRRRPDQMKCILAVQGVGEEILEAKDGERDTALMTAMKTYHWASAELLIRCGAKTDWILEWADSRGVSVWDEARISRLIRQGPWDL